MTPRRPAALFTAAVLTVILTVDPFGLALTAQPAASAATASTETRETNRENAVGALDPANAESAVDLGGSFESVTTPAGLDTLGTETPGTGTAVIPVSDTATPTNVGDLPVTVSAVDASSPTQVEVALLDSENVDTLGAGLLMTVEPTQPVESGSKVELTIDYATFAGREGSDWSSRLRAVYLPCGAAPSEASVAADSDCDVIPVETANDPDSATLTAVVPLDDAAAAPSTAEARTVTASAAGAGDGALAIIASASGVGGDWGATSLSAASSWTQTGSSGAFSWSYPLPVTLPAPGPAPQLALTYSSAVVDGRTPMSNNQSGWVGEGFDLSTGYVERMFVSCDDDKAAWAGRGDPNNKSKASVDLCWREDNATLVLNGTATPLVKTADGWVPETDDGTLVERLTTSGREYWRVTTVDGTVSYFGRSWAAENGTSGSAWTVPVYGNHAGEPCHATAFADSSCRTVWRWNIDRVTDPLGQEMTYSYAPETNYYVPNYTAGLDRPGTWYTAGGRLVSISYGKQASGASTLGRIEFDAASRCLTTRDDGRALCSTLDATQPDRNWPDTPKDLQCTDAADCENYSPVFFDSTRLSKIRARVLDGTAYKTTDTWTLAHKYVAQGGTTRDTTNLILTLDSVTHTASPTISGQATIVEKPIEFGYTFDENRVFSETDGHGRLIRPRLSTILTETSGQVSVNYEKDDDCTPQKKPRNPTAAQQSSNTDFCYPVRWNPNETQRTQVDWFHKYVVESIIEDGTPPLEEGETNELITGSLSKETHYTYEHAGWAKPVSPIISSTDPDTTYSEFRGARRVGTIVGEKTTGVATETTYYLGTGDTIAAGPDSASTVADNRAELAGQSFSTVTFTDTPEESDPVKASETLSRVDVLTTINGSLTDHDAHRVQRSSTTTYTYYRTGSLQHSIKNEVLFNDDAQPVQATDYGNSSTADDNVCTVTAYADLPGNKVAYPSSTTTRSGDCATGSMLSRAGATYDSTTGKVLTEWTSASSTRNIVDATYTYDARGRVTSVTDGAGNKTATAYTTTAIGQVTEVTTTHPDPDGSAGPKASPVTRAFLDPLSGVTTKTLDANGQPTYGTYDALERLTVARYPQHTDASYPSARYTYATSANGTNTVKTETLAADGKSYHVDVQIYDGLLRQIQTQTESRNTGSNRDASKAARGRVVTHVIYDAAGRVATNLGPWLAKGSVSSVAIVPVMGPPSRTDYTYDLAGRVILERFCVENACNPGQEKWKTTTHYNGATTIVVPPAGGVPTAQVTDRRGNVTQTIEYLRTSGSTTAAYSSITALSKQTTTYRYDGLNRIISMSDPASNKWEYEFDLAGRQVSATDPDSGVTTTTYNDIGLRTKQSDARGKFLTFTYDGLGRPVEQRNNGSATPAVSWTYDGTNGADGTPAIGVLTSSTRHSGGLTYTSTVLGYDAAYRPTGVRTTLPTDADLKALSGESYDVGYTYTADGQVASTTLPAVTRPDGSIVMSKETVTTFYDTASVPRWATGGFGWGTYVAESLFDERGRPLAMDLGNTYGAVVSYGWEKGTDRLSRIALDRQRVNGTEVELRYDYDAAGNVSSILDQPTSNSSSVQDDAQCYKYDPLRRLKTHWTDPGAACETAPTAWDQVAGGPAPGWTDYTYDAIGNRTSKVVRSSSGTVTTASKFGEANMGPHQLTSQTITGQSSVAYTWDAAGHQTSRAQGANTSTYAWDAEGELVQSTGAGGTIESTYDAAGSRLIKAEGGEITVYLPGGMEISSTSTTAVAATRWYSFAGQRVAHRTGNGLGKVTSVVTDHQGSIVATVHNTNWTASVVRQRSDPFGGKRSSQATTSSGRGFLGAPHDASGLVLLGARHLDSANGAFISVDPLLDVRKPAHFNAYSYAESNPATMSDPSGLVATMLMYIGGTGGNPRASSTPAKKPGSTGSSYWDHAQNQALGIKPKTHSSYSSSPFGNSYGKYTAEQQTITRATLDIVLTAVGFVFEPADGLSGLICVAEGDMVCAGLSFGSIVPVGGWASGAAKMARAADEIAQASSAMTKKSQVTANKAAGDAARDNIAAMYPGSDIDEFFPTSSGARYVDILTPGGVAIESKVGRTSLTSGIRAQIEKDKYLLQNSEVTAIEWVFSRSGQTGKIGPTDSVKNALESAGISWRLNE